MIDRSYVQTKAGEILRKVSSEAEFLSQAARGAIEFIRERPLMWKWYGPYWLNLRDVLSRHAPREFHELQRFIGDDLKAFGDEDLQKKYDYGTDLNNWIAAAAYIEARAETYELTSEVHTVEDVDDTKRPYKTDSGFSDIDE